MVAFLVCIEHGKEHLLTIQRDGMSYQKDEKYEEKIDGLSDGRGRTKVGSNLTTMFRKVTPKK
jgi:hypothetical protein